jgi:CheY-like chemotaxis protein
LLTLGALRLTISGAAGVGTPHVGQPPAGSPEAPERRREPARPHGAPAQPSAAILLATTTPLLRRAMRALLEDAGLPVLEAADGMGALLLHACMRPSVAVIDFRLPDMDGLDLTRRLRAANPPVEVIMHTRASAGAIEDLAASAGARAVIAWDSPPRMLLTTVSDALDALGASRSVPPQERS